jgi:hypothetical protein
VTNNPLAELLGDHRVTERVPTMIGREPDPVSTELVSPILGDDLIRLCEDVAMTSATNETQNALRAALPTGGIGAQSDRSEMEVPYGT